MYEVIKHLQYYNLPLLQRQIIRILIMLPIYGIGSALSLTAPSVSLYLATVRDVYEAFVIHCFLQVMLDYPGGEAKVVEGISERPKLRQPVPCCCLPSMRLDHSFILWCKRMTLQFVILKPLIAVLSVVFMNIPLPRELGAEEIDYQNTAGDATGAAAGHRLLGALAGGLLNATATGGAPALVGFGAAARRLSGGGGGHHDFTGTLYASEAWQYILLIVYNMSYTLALYYLLLFYMATKTLLTGFHAGECGCATDQRPPATVRAGARDRAIRSARYHGGYDFSPSPPAPFPPRLPFSRQVRRGEDHRVRDVLPVPAGGHPRHRHGRAGRLRALERLHREWLTPTDRYRPLRPLPLRCSRRYSPHTASRRPLRPSPHASLLLYAPSPSLPAAVR